MDGKWLLGFGIGGLVGIGLGVIVGNYEIDRLEAERDSLELQNECLKSDLEITKMTCDNLKAAKDLFANLLLQEKEDEGG